MAFLVKTSAKAKRDLQTIWNWLLDEQAGDAGLRWFKGLREAILSLSESPLRCVLAPENEAFPFEVRQLLYGKRSHALRILFAIEGNVVTVLHIRHGRRLTVSPK